MNLRLVFAATAAALFVPLSAGTALASDIGRVPGPVQQAPRDTYSPACADAYQVGWPAFDLLGQMGPGYASEVETAVCGKRRHF